MADTSGSGLTKSQKKNLRRKGVKDGDDNAAGGDPIANLRQQLAEAKESQDHKLANELRQQLWIAQDLAAGYKPKIDEEDAKAQAILNSVQSKKPSALGSSSSSASPSPSSTDSTSSSQRTQTVVTSVSVIDNGEEERKLKGLKKKLAKIEQLKKRKEQGDKLEKNQLDKIETEATIVEEIDHLEQLLSIPVKR